MITESKVTEIFCIADDFCKEFEVEMAKNSLPSSPEAPKRCRKRMMSDAEVITILICFHFNTYRNFKHYYLSCVCGQWKHLFPRRFSYNRFVEIMPRCFISQSLFGHLWDNGVHIVTGLRSNMKQRLMPLYDKIMLRKRSITESNR